MDSVGMLRPLKTGGCSLCKSPDERVGMGRCMHIMDMSNTIKIEWDGTSYVGNVTIDDIDVKVSQKKIKDFLKTIENALTKEQKDSILEKLRNG